MMTQWLCKTHPLDLLCLVFTKSGWKSSLVNFDVNLFDPFIHTQYCLAFTAKAPQRDRVVLHLSISEHGDHRYLLE